MKIFKIFQLAALFSPLAALAWFSSCATPPDYPIEPFIEYVAVSKDTLQRNVVSPDETFVTFSFTDGDGDLGDRDTLVLFVTDTRTGVLSNQYKVPEVPELGASNGIKGEITFRVLSSCCNFPDDLMLDPCFDETPLYRYDKIVYEIYLKDRAGHQSNTIRTDTIYLRCFD